MVKKIISVATAFLMLCCIIPFGAFADDVLEDCPKCGEHTYTKLQDFSMSTSDFSFPIAIKKRYCSSCNYTYYEWNCLGMTGYKEFDDGGYSVIVDYLREWANNTFGKNATATQAPSGIGRKDLPGYADDNGTPSVASDGGLIWHPTIEDILSVESNKGIEFNLNSDGSIYYCYFSGPSSSPFFENGHAYIKNCLTNVDMTNDGFHFYYDEDTAKSVISPIFRANFTFKLPVRGNITRLKTPCMYHEQSKNTYYYNEYNFGLKDIFSAKTYVSTWKLDKTYFDYRYDFYFYLPTFKIIPYEDSDKPTSETNITINNNVWSGNIYTDNSTNLTYIYPQYTTINENNETVTNISENPIIYNNSTNQYYTYDTVTNNYYYITYEEPSPSPTPAPTWTPGGGATRGGGVGRHPSDTDAADWTLHYYILNNRRYDAYYALKKTEVDTETKLPWVDNKKYISTTQIPIANGQYTVSVPDGVYWRVWQWDEASQTLTGVNSSNWHSTINNFLFNATGEYIFEFCKADGSDFDTAKDVTLKLKNDKITDYEDGGTIVEEPTPSPSPEPTETPSPTEPPTPTATPNPGGGTVPTPGGGTSGGNGSGVSGGDDEGLFGWIWDLLKDIVKSILKAIFKIIANILGFLIWIVERVGLLLPFLPGPAVAALGAGVVLIFVIRIIRFIRG